MDYIYWSIVLFIIFLGILIYIIRANKIQLWRIFFVLLLVINVLFVSFAIKAFSIYMGAMSAFVIFPMALPLAIIDFIAVFFYFRKQHPKGIIAKVISYTVFIAVSFVITYIAWNVILIWLMGHSNSNFFSFLVNPALGILIAIVATVLIVGFLRPKSRK